MSARKSIFPHGKPDLAAPAPSPVPRRSTPTVPNKPSRSGSVTACPTAWAPVMARLSTASSNRPRTLLRPSSCSVTTCGGYTKGLHHVFHQFHERALFTTWTKGYRGTIEVGGLGIITMLPGGCRFTTQKPWFCIAPVRDLANMGGVDIFDIN